MSDDLPPGFVIAAKPTADDLPPGFVAQPKKDFQWTRDTITGRLAKGIYDAVTLPGDVAQGNVDMWKDGHTNPEVINRSAELASVASPMSPAARSGVGWAGVVKTKEAPPPTQEALVAAADKGYTSARDLGVEIQPQAISDLGGKIGSHLTEMGIDGELAPKTFSILKRLENPPEGAVATVPNIETIRRSFGHAASDFSNPTEQLAASRAKQHLADYLAAIPDQDVIRGPASEVSGLIKNANGNYAAAKRAELLAEELGKAEQNAAAANSGANLGNAQRQKLKQIYQNDRKSAGFSDEELAQADRVIRGTPVANATRAMGNALGGGGGLGAAASAAIGGAATAHMGGIGAVAPVVGYALKKYSDRVGQKELELLQAMVRRRSPLAEGLPQTVTDSVSPTKAALARALMLGAVPQQ